ncbi:MAG: hypothetical protein GQ477_00515 [Nanohaloarchaea archaeon]|nr:hypothetical protein [Candidatus Nanohaloarchaea archaeon]
MSDNDINGTPETNEINTITESLVFDVRDDSYTNIFDELEPSNPESLSIFDESFVNNSQSKPQESIWIHMLDGISEDLLSYLDSAIKANGYPSNENLIYLPNIFDITSSNNTPTYRSSVKIPVNSDTSLYSEKVIAALNDKLAEDNQFECDRYKSNDGTSFKMGLLEIIYSGTKEYTPENNEDAYIHIIETTCEPGQPYLQSYLDISEIANYLFDALHEMGLLNEYDVQTTESRHITF